VRELGGDDVAAFGGLDVERGDDAQVGAGAARVPEEIGVVLCVRAHRGAVR
jgi:hypothetical protein